MGIIVHKDLKRILLTEEEINDIVTKLANRINDEYSGEEVHVLVILKGSMIFASDLIRKIRVPVTLDFMQASSYNMGTKSTGEIKIRLDLKESIDGKNVIVVEDIIDSGNTLFALKKILKERNPKSLKICAMLDKPSRREADIVAEYIGAEIPDEFVVGYGLDYAEHYRELPYIGVLGEWMYS